jgi:hypothetical protein
LEVPVLATITRKEPPTATRDAGASIHPQTRGAWGRWLGIAPVLPEGHDPDSFVRAHGVGALCDLLGMPRPGRYDAKARAAARYERTWDRIEADYARREGTALWWEEGIADGARQRAARAERARQEAALAEVRGRLAVHGGASPEARAAGWLSYRRADSSDAAFRACVGLVRGFALGEGAALALMRADYEPRFHRKFLKGELAGMVRRAGRSGKPLGYLLHEERRAG